MTALPPIETEKGRVVPDGKEVRAYIPLPAGWELQTKGTGSTYRVLDRKTNERMGLFGLDQRTLDFITRMGMELREAFENAAKAERTRIVELLRKDPLQDRCPFRVGSTLEEQPEVDEPCPICGDLGDLNPITESRCDEDMRFRIIRLIEQS